MAYISKLTLPIGNETVTFNLADAYVRQKLAGGLAFVVCWDGTATPVVANIPAGVKVTYQGEEYTGTKAASTAEPLTFYLVKSATQVGSLDVFDEYVAAGQSGSKAWEKIGSTSFDYSSLKALAFKDEVVLSKGSSINVLGKNTIFENAASDVNFTTEHTTDYALGTSTTLAGQASSVTVTGTTKSKVLGADTTFKAAASDVVFSGNHTSDDALGANATFTTTVTPSTKYLKATASNMAIASDGNEAEVLTGFGTHSTGSFYDSVNDENGYLETEEIYGVDGTENVSHVTPDNAAYLELTSIPTVKYADNEYKTGSADSWAFSYDSSTGLLEISGANGTAMELETNGTTAATGDTVSSSSGAGSSIVTGLTIESKTVAKKAASATTVATGGSTMDDSGSIGDSVTLGLITDTDSALTALGEAQTADAVTGVVVTDPTIALELVNDSAAGEVEVMNAISSAATTVNNADTVSAITALASATAEGQVISIDSKDEINAVTGIGTAVAAGQEVTVGDNDLVEVITALGNAEAEAQVITVTPDTVAVAGYDALGVSVQ